MTARPLPIIKSVFKIREHISEAPDIYSETEFRAILKHEYACVNRNGHKFSLIVFDLDGLENGNVAVNRLMFIFCSRLRRTDGVGWLSKRRIGVLLPFTDARGARRVAAEICSVSFVSELVSDFSVCTYPSRCWLDSEEADSRQMHFSDISPEWENDSCTLINSPTSDITILKTDTPNKPSLAKISGPEIGTIDKIMRSLTCPVPFWKRAMDIVISLMGLVLLSPLFLMVTVLIKTVSRGPVFFRQERVGYLGKVFCFLKFRTMKANADQSEHQKHVLQLINGNSGGDVDKPMEKITNDCRIIPLGKFLRKTCLDELPQLVNVLRGQMSLVGPRPCLPYEAGEYHLWHTERFNTLPGMTGLWQVSGKNRLTFKEMIRYDITYALKRSFRLDIKIIFKTFPVVFLEIKSSGKKKIKKKNLILKESMTNA
jgi:lipopolysaccharide/colanic/teichoic acid biosynthesis glycosyltransferase